MFGIEPKQKMIIGGAGILVCVLLIVIAWFVPCVGCMVQVIAGVGLLASLAVLLVGVVEYTSKG